VSEYKSEIKELKAENDELAVIIKTSPDRHFKI